jgi:hypothetical protein
MLISMPTGSSTIFGVFQLIRVSQVVWHDVRAGAEPRSTAGVTQVRWVETERCAPLHTPDTSLLDKVISLLDKWFRVERKIAALFNQDRYSRCATASGICEVIHAITVQSIIHCIPHHLSDAAGRRSRQRTTTPTHAERSHFARDPDRERAFRPEVDG